jgi:hypothetical protein
MVKQLSPALQQQLDQIEPTTVLGALVYPCSAHLVYPYSAHMGEAGLLKCVYFADWTAFTRLHGEEEPPDRVYPSRCIAADQVASIGLSPYRLPARFANQIYQRGESGMGWNGFTLVFSWWCRSHYIVGSLVDFLGYPLWYSPEDVKEVLLYDRKKRGRSSLDSYWCVFTRGSEPHV